MKTFDAVILGAGHNGLIVQAYLARAGWSTVCLERGPRVGGGLATEELPAGSGFLHNTHSFYHRGLTHLPWYRQLDLARHGAEYLRPDLNVVLLADDGRTLEWWTDFERTFSSFAAIDPVDAEKLADWRERFQPIVREILVPEAQSPPQPAVDRQARLQQSPHGRLLLEVAQASPLEFVEREFRHPLIRSALLFFNGLREVDLRCPGFGHHIPSLLAADRFAEICRGGSVGLARAFQSVIEAAGGELVVEAQPQQILTDAGRVSGVSLTDGRVFSARRAVISSLNPQQTFLDLMTAAQVPDLWRERAGRYQYNVLAPLFGVYANLSQPPRYRAFADRPELQEALMVILGLNDSDQFSEIVAAHEAGRIPATRVMWGSCPSRHDPSQAPSGQHSAFLWEKLPYALGGDPRNWEREGHEHGRRVLQAWQTAAPNVAEAVLETFHRTPVDTAVRLPNMRFGDLLVGAFTGGQVGDHRPFAGAGRYRTCFDGLYLCGSCCHPGGNITGLPGYNCVQALASDFDFQLPD